MSKTNLGLQGAVLSVPVVNELTDNAVITALSLEDIVFMGLTYGAWFKVAMFLSVFLLVILNASKVVKEYLVPFIKWVYHKL